MSEQTPIKAQPAEDLTQANQTIAQLHQKVAELETLVKRGQQAEEQLQSSEERFRQLVLSISDHIYVTEISPEGHRTNRYLSPHAETLTGYPLTTLLTDWSIWPAQIIHPDDQVAAAAQAKQLAQGKNSEMEYRLIKTDGKVIWVRDSARVEPVGASKMVYGVVSDVTERKHKETALAKLLELSRALVTYHDPMQLLDQAIKAATDLAPGADRGSLQLLDEAGETLQTVAISTPGEVLGQTITFRPGVGIAGHALANNQTINVPEVLNDDRFVHSNLPLRFHSLLVAPLVVKGRLLGTLSLSSKKANAFSKADEVLVQLIADQVGAALENARLFASYLQAEKLRKAYQFLQATIDAVASHIAILDESGKIIAVNARWHLYAAANGYDGPDHGLGVNYLEICDLAPGDNAEEAPIVATGIRQVMSGQRTQFYLEYPAFNPLEQLWFGVRVTRFQNEGATWIVIAHEDVTERRVAEDALRASEEQYRNLTNHLPVGVYRDTPNNKLVYANPALAAILGYGNVEDLIQQISIRDAFDNPLERDAQLDARRLSDEIAYNEMKLRTENGAQIWVRDIARVFLDDSGNVAYIDGIMQDITEYKEAAKALQASESRFRSLVQNSSDIIILLPLDGTIQYISPPVEGILGYDSKTLVGQNLFNYLHPEDLARVQTKFNELVLHAGGSTPIEFRLRHAHKGWVWMEAVGNNLLDDPNVKGIVVNGRDISKRKQVEERLHLLAAAIDSAHEGILITATQPESAEPKIVFVNKGLSHITGYTQEELMGQTPRLFEGPKTDQTLLARLRNTQARGQSFNNETINYRRDGSEYYAAWHISPVLDLAGRVTHYVSIQRDVTKIKQLEAQFLQAQKMEAVGRLAGGVAHDFNNLLTVIKGYSDLLIFRLPETDKLRQFAEQVRKAADQAALLTRQLLVFSRQEVAQPEIFDINKVVINVETMLRRLIGEDIDLVTDLAESLGPIKANAGQVEQVLLNLVVNARDAMPQGGQLTIQTKNITLLDTTFLQPMSVEPGQYIQLSVSDTGTGIDDKTLSHIFEPFYTTKEKGKGTGLGLSTVYAIVTQSNGSIQVASEVGKGTTFDIYLPTLIEDDSDYSDPKLSEQAPVEMEKGHEIILLVEDEDGVRELAKLVLSEHGYQVLEARHGEEALQLCMQQSGSIQLLLTDVVVPGGLSGRELADRLKPLQTKAKVLYMSGYTDDVIGQHGVKNAGMNFLQKPFTPSTLINKVRETLDAPD